MAHLGGLPGESAAGVPVGDPGEPFRLVKRQWAQQQRVHDAEYGRARADTQSDDQDREGGESGIPAQRSKRVAQILQDGVECGQTSGIGHVCIYCRVAIWLLPRLRGIETYRVHTSVNAARNSAYATNYPRTASNIQYKGRSGFVYSRALQRSSASSRTLHRSAGCMGAHPIAVQYTRCARMASCALAGKDFRVI